MSAVTLTKRQAEIRRFMLDFFKANDQLPPMHVISTHFGFSAINSADTHVKQLERKGVIEKNAVGKYRFVRKVAA